MSAPEPKPLRCLYVRLPLVLAVAGGLCALAAGPASAATCSAATTEQLESCVKTINGNAEANTIQLVNKTYEPGPKALTLTNKHGLQTIEGTTAEGVIDGGNIESEHPELLIIGEGVSAKFRDIVISHAGAGVSAAIEDFGALDVEGSTIAGTGPGITVQATGSLTALNASIINGSGVGVINDPGGSASFKNATIAFNKLGGITNNGTLSLTNTIIAENGEPECEGLAATTNDHNLSSDATCNAEKNNVSPLLSSSFNDGGPTQLRSLRPGSPAIEAGDTAACPSTDQRGVTRPTVAGHPCSIGADEYNNFPPTINVPATKVVKETTETEAIVEYQASAESSPDAIREFKCTPASGSKFPIGVTTVKCKAKTGHEATAEKSFEVEVILGSGTTTTTTTTAPITTTTTTTTTAPTTTTTTAPTTTTTTAPTTTTTTAPTTTTTTTTAPTTTTTTSKSTTTTTAPTTTTTTSKSTTTTLPTTTTTTSKSTTTTTAPTTTTTTAAVTTTTETTTPTPTMTLTTTTTTTSSHVPPETPAEELRQLLNEVQGSKIPSGLRHELVQLLQQALHGVTGLSGDAKVSQLQALAFQEGWTLVQEPFAPLDSLAAATVSTSQHFVPAAACGALERFVDVIQKDQRSHKPKIPSALAKAWVTSARAIESQVGCGSLHHHHHSGSNKHSHGHSSRHKQHRR